MNVGGVCSECGSRVVNGYFALNSGSCVAGIYAGDNGAVSHGEASAGLYEVAVLASSVIVPVVSAVVEYEVDCSAVLNLDGFLYPAVASGIHLLAGNRGPCGAAVGRVVNVSGVCAELGCGIVNYGSRVGIGLDGNRFLSAYAVSSRDNIDGSGIYARNSSVGRNGCHRIVGGRPGYVLICSIVGLDGRRKLNRLVFHNGSVTGHSHGCYVNNTGILGYFNGNRIGLAARSCSDRRSCRA